MAMGPSTDAESKMLDWRTASISAGGNCVQVAALGGRYRGQGLQESGARVSALQG